MYLKISFIILKPLKTIENIFKEILIPEILFLPMGILVNLTWVPVYQMRESACSLPMLDSNLKYTN